MAHFAKLDDDNKVIEIHVVSNNALDSANEEESGIAFLTQWSGGYTNWKQTSYNGSFRKNYAGVGYEYNPNLDAFIPPKPFQSWILDENCIWQAPVRYPNDATDYVWNEELGEWVNAETL